MKETQSFWTQGKIQFFNIACKTLLPWTVWLFPLNSPYTLCPLDTHTPVNDLPLFFLGNICPLASGLLHVLFFCSSVVSQLSDLKIFLINTSLIPRLDHILLTVCSQSPCM